MPVYKTCVVVTVLLEADTQEAAQAAVQEAGLKGLAYQINDGDWIGHVDDGDIFEVPPDKVQDELIAIGNDGSFFNVE